MNEILTLFNVVECLDNMIFVLYFKLNYHPFKCSQ